MFHQLNPYFVDLNILKYGRRSILFIIRQMGPCIVGGTRQIKDIFDSPKALKEEIEEDDFFKYASELLGQKIFTRFDKNGITTNDLAIVDEDLQYQNYIKALQNSRINNDPSITKILSNLYYKYKQQKEKKNRKSEPQDSSNVNLKETQAINMNVIKYFIFFYTADEIYSKMFKKNIRKQNYSQIADVVKLLMPHISQHIRNQQKEAILAKSEYNIFKFFPSTTDATICQLSRRIGSRGYFGSFFLAETRQANAKRKNSWLTIKVNPQIKHQFLIVKLPYIQEKESLKFIIFPFFHYQIKQEDKTSTKINVFIDQADPPSSRP